MIVVLGNHANTLHRIDNDGPVNEGGPTPVDAGVEVDPLHTTDTTRILPISGCFTEVQARVYQTVLGACEVALARMNELGARFRDVHDAAMPIIATRLRERGLLPVSVEKSLSSAGQQHRHQMPHSTNHHLGPDVHDCTQARREMYRDVFLEPGMTFTIEPDLYFRADDEATPAEHRGIGVRTEDDVVVNEDGSVTRISEDIPRTIDDAEAWIARTQGH